MVLFHPADGGRCSDNWLRQHASGCCQIVCDGSSTSKFSQKINSYSVFSAPQLHSPDLIILLSSANGFASFFVCLVWLPCLQPVETVCGWFPCSEMTRAKVRRFHDSFPLCCMQWMVFWVSHSDAKHRKDFLHMQAPRPRYALNQSSWVLSNSLKFLCFFFSWWFHKPICIPCLCVWWRWLVNTAYPLENFLVSYGASLNSSARIIGL